MDTDSSRPDRAPGLAYAWPVTVGIGCCLAMALTFPVLQHLMRQRPQFAGAPLHASRVVLAQASPRIVLRKVRDDVSDHRAFQAERTDVTFNMRGRRDYRGLRTIIDMAGDVEVRYTLVNPYDEPAYVLFKCPHPQAEGKPGELLNAGALKLDAGGQGMVENAPSAWFWTGEMAGGASQDITITYHVSRVSGVVYRVNSEDGLPVRTHRVTMVMDDLPSMRFQSSDGRAEPHGDTVVWERSDFLPPEHFSASIAETRSLYKAMDNLLGIGPLVSLLFMVAVLSILFARGQPTALHIVTIAIGYAFYFPLVLYLSAKFRFPVALVIAFVAPGILLLNYTRVLLGPRLGLVGGGLFLLLYQVFPTLGAFAGWNRGIVLLCLGMVTLFVLIDLQNRALKRATTAVLLVFLVAAGSARADERTIQVMVPGRLVDEAEKEPPLTLVSFGTASYVLDSHDRYVDVRVSLPVEILEVGEDLVHLIRPVHLLEAELPEVVRLVSQPMSASLQALEPGEGVVELTYRAPVTQTGNQRNTVVPLLSVAAGQVVLTDKRSDLEFTNGRIWSVEKIGDSYRYELGIAGARDLGIKAPSGVAGAEGQGAPSLERVYGIRITESQHLTVMGSDGTCTHFAEYQLPPFHPGTVELQLPEGSRIISASVDAYEIEEPRVEDGRCTVNLDREAAAGSSRRLSLRLALPPVRLGFFGVSELTLPDPGATIGTLRWTIVLPSGFETRVQSSGLEELRPPSDLTGFGDYGRVLQSRDRISLGKTLVPPGVITSRVRYRQQIRGMTDHAETTSDGDDG